MKFPTLAELDTVASYSGAVDAYLGSLLRQEELDARGLKEMLDGLRIPVPAEESGDWNGAAGQVIGRIIRLHAVSKFIPLCFISERISGEDWAALDDAVASTLPQLYDQLLASLPEGIELRFNPRGPGFFLTPSPRTDGTGNLR